MQDITYEIYLQQEATHHRACLSSKSKKEMKFPRLEKSIGSGLTLSGHVETMKLAIWPQTLH